MSVTIPQSYVEQFSAMVHMLAEQKRSRLRGTTQVEEVTGESFSRERIGTTQDAPNVVTDLHGDTPLNNTPHSRRWGYIADYDVADLIDKQSKVKLLIDPQGRYVMRHAGVMGRGFDDAVITALGGNAAQGKNGGTTVALPSAQKIVSGSTGMTVQKLIDAKKTLDAAEVDEDLARYIVMSSQQFADLLEDTKVTSSDYNTVQALVQGKIDTFMGFKFLRSERLNTSGSDRLCYAYTELAVLVGMQVEPNSVVSPRPDKRMAMQVYTYGAWGAVRLEDEQVVEIAATE